jgi:hypothetical protein
VEDLIIGFGFGDPLTSIMMLFVTSLISYLIFKTLRKNRESGLGNESERQKLRAYYHMQRKRAQEMIREFDLSDEEIERRIEEDLRR